MPEHHRIAIVPARNEEDAVAGVVEELRAFDAELDVVVIDDGSEDLTAERAAAAGAAVVRLPFNLGIGGAVQTGFKYALEHGFEVVVRLDGDGQHDPQQIPNLLAPLERVLEARLDGAADAEVEGEADDSRAGRSRTLGRQVLGAVVDHDHIELGVVCPQLLDHARDGILLVSGGHDRDAVVLRHERLP